MIATGTGLQADLLPSRDHSIIADGKRGDHLQPSERENGFSAVGLFRSKAEKRPIREANQPLQLAFSGAGAAGC